MPENNHALTQNASVVYAIEMHTKLLLSRYQVSRKCVRNEKYSFKHGNLRLRFGVSVVSQFEYKFLPRDAKHPRY